MILLWSSSSINSSWVKNEAQEGIDRQVPLHPILIEEVTPPFEFKRLQASKLYDWDGSDAHAELPILLDTISRSVGSRRDTMSPAFIETAQPIDATQIAPGSTFQTLDGTQQTGDSPSASNERVPTSGQSANDKGPRRQSGKCWLPLVMVVVALVALVIWLTVNQENRQETEQQQHPPPETLTGHLRLQSVLSAGGEPIEACFDVFHAEQDIDGNRTKVDRQCTTTAKFTLNAGRYHVNTWSGEATASNEFEVLPGELASNTMTLGENF